MSKEKEYNSLLNNFFLTEYPPEVKSFISSIDVDSVNKFCFDLTFKPVEIHDSKVHMKKVVSNTGFACVLGKFVVIHHNSEIMVCEFDKVESLRIDHREIKYPSIDL